MRENLAEWINRRGSSHNNLWTLLLTRIYALLCVTVLGPGPKNVATLTENILSTQRSKHDLINGLPNVLLYSYFGPNFEYVREI